MEAIFIFILKAITAVTYIGMLIGFPIFCIWLIVCLVKIIFGKDSLSGHFPWYGWF